jgi:hypothetical protein
VHHDGENQEGRDTNEDTRSLEEGKQSGIQDREGKMLCLGTDAKVRAKSTMRRTSFTWGQEQETEKQLRLGSHPTPEPLLNKGNYVQSRCHPFSFSK